MLCFQLGEDYANPSHVKEIEGHKFELPQWCHDCISKGISDPPKRAIHGWLGAFTLVYVVLLMLHFAVKLGPCT